VLGDEPAGTTYLSEYSLFVRWSTAESEDELLSSVDSALSNASWKEELVWDVPGSVVLFDSVQPGSEFDAGGYLHRARSPCMALPVVLAPAWCRRAVEDGHHDVVRQPVVDG
jgi:hypothetical protein